MMLAIEKENERENPSYQHCTFTFAALQHAADEGTSMGHYEVLKKLCKLYLTSRKDYPYDLRVL